MKSASVKKKSTKDARKPFHVVTKLHGLLIKDEAISDPFIRTFINVGWSDRFKALFRKNMLIEVSVYADWDATRDVMNAIQKLPAEMPDKTVEPGAYYSE